MYYFKSFLILALVISTTLYINIINTTWKNVTWLTCAGRRKHPHIEVEGCPSSSVRAVNDSVVVRQR